MMMPLRGSASFGTVLLTATSTPSRRPTSTRCSTGLRRDRRPRSCVRSVRSSAAPHPPTAPPPSRRSHATAPPVRATARGIGAGVAQHNRRGLRCWASATPPTAPRPHSRAPAARRTRRRFAVVHRDRRCRARTTPRTTRSRRSLRRSRSTPSRRRLRSSATPACSVSVYGPSVQVTLSGSDTGGSGFAAIGAATNGTDPTLSSTLYEPPPFTLSATTNVKYQRMRTITEDAEATKSTPIAVDAGPRPSRRSPVTAPPAPVVGPARRSRCRSRPPTRVVPVSKPCARRERRRPDDGEPGVQHTVRGRVDHDGQGPRVGPRRQRRGAEGAADRDRHACTRLDARVQRRRMSRCVVAHVGAGDAYRRRRRSVRCCRDPLASTVPTNDLEPGLQTRRSRSRARPPSSPTPSNKRANAEPAQLTVPDGRPGCSVSAVSCGGALGIVMGTPARCTLAAAADAGGSGVASVRYTTDGSTRLRARRTARHLSCVRRAGDGTCHRQCGRPRARSRRCSCR